ncbi:hypothetical protein JCM16814_16190 [Desulfobaculum senezii]
MEDPAPGRLAVLRTTASKLKFHLKEEHKAAKWLPFFVAQRGASGCEAAFAADEGNASHPARQGVPFGAGSGMLKRLGLLGDGAGGLTPLWPAVTVGWTPL